MPQVMESPSGRILHGSVAGQGAKLPAPAAPVAAPAAPVAPPPVPAAPAAEPKAPAEPPLPPCPGAPARAKAEPAAAPPAPVAAPAVLLEPPCDCGAPLEPALTTGAPPAPALCAAPALGAPPKPSFDPSLEQPKTRASALSAQTPRTAFIETIDRVMGEFNSGEGNVVRCARQMTQIRRASRATKLSPPRCARQHRARTPTSQQQC